MIGGGGGEAEAIMPPTADGSKKPMSSRVKRIVPPDMLFIMAWRSGTKDA